MQESLNHGEIAQWSPENSKALQVIALMVFALTYCVSVAQYLVNEHLLAASLILLGGEGCPPTGVSGLAVQVPCR